MLPAAGHNLRKGSQMYVAGQIRTRSYADKDRVGKDATNNCYLEPFALNNMDDDVPHHERNEQGAGEAPRGKRGRFWSYQQAGRLPAIPPLLLLLKSRQIDGPYLSTPTIQKATAASGGTQATVLSTRSEEAAPV